MAELGDFLLKKKSKKTAKLTPLTNAPAPPQEAAATPSPISPAKLRTLSSMASSSTSPSPSPTSLHAASPLPTYAGRTTRTGPYNVKQMARLVPIAKVLDFSFLEIADIGAIVDMDPRSGELFGSGKSNQNSPVRHGQVRASASPTALHNMKLPGEEDEEDQVDVDRRNLRQVDDKQKHTFNDEEKEKTKGKTKTTTDGIKVMKARGETYAFKETKPVELDKDLRGFTLDEKGNLVERQRTMEEIQAEEADLPRFHCTSLKLDNNELTGLQPTAVQLAQHKSRVAQMSKTSNPPPPPVGGLANIQVVFAKRLHAPFSTLVHLDLSFNHIETLPTFSGLPLHTLQLHKNWISNGKEINQLRGLERTLRKLTLNANPFQQKVSKYKYFVLHSLPFLHSLDDVRVTSSEMQVLVTFDKMYVKPKHRRTAEIEKYAKALVTTTTATQ